MEEKNNKKMYGLNGLLGYIIIIVVLLSILFILGYNALKIQQRESTNYYKINQELDGLSTKDTQNHKNYILIKEEEK